MTGCTTDAPAAALISVPKPNALAGLVYNVVPTTEAAAIALISFI